MEIPTYDQCMLPLLQLASDTEEHRIRHAIDALADHFQLSQDELDDLLPSGRETTFSNRVRWANTYLQKANLLESTGRGRFRITDLGLRVVNNPPEAIDKHFLMQFESFIEFQERSTSDDDIRSGVSESENTRTPVELLNSSIKGIREQLIEELLEQIMACSDKFFERLVVDVLQAMGYGSAFKGSGKVVGGSGDGGIDGIIHMDRLGFDVIYVQAKRWKPGTSVGRPVVQGFAGSLLGQGLGKGVMITTAQFTRDATDYADNLQGQKIILVDGRKLAQLMIEHNVGVYIEDTYVIKKVDTDFFQLEG